MRAGPRQETTFYGWGSVLVSQLNKNDHMSECWDAAWDLLLGTSGCFRLYLEDDSVRISCL